jgi:hypothetical protein
MPKTAVHCSVAESLDRIGDCLATLHYDLESGDRSQALRDAGELAEVARRLWCYLANAEGFACGEVQVRLAAGGNN